jgi:hypothetical protein
VCGDPYTPTWSVYRICPPHRPGWQTGAPGFGLPNLFIAHYGSESSRLKRSAVGPAHLGTEIGGFSVGFPGSVGFEWFLETFSPVFLIQWVSSVFSSFTSFFFIFLHFSISCFSTFYKF